MAEHSASLPVGELVNNPDRQSLLRTGIILGTAALGSVVALDLTSQLTLWRKNSTEIVEATSDESSKGEPRWLAIPGLGRQNGRFIAEDLSEVLPGVVDYANLSDFGISGKKVGRALAKYYERHYSVSNESQRPQNVLLHSMGLPTFLKGVEWCIKNRVPVPPVGKMMAFSSPMNPKHTFMERQINMMASNPYPGGALSKLCVEYYLNHRTEKFKLSASAIGSCLLKALQRSITGCSPALWSSQVRAIHRKEPYRPGIFDGVITPESKVFLYGDENDKTVNVPATRKDMADFLAPYGATLIVVDTPDLGHANIPETKSYVRHVLAEAA